MTQVTLNWNYQQVKKTFYNGNAVDTFNYNEHQVDFNPLTITPIMIGSENYHVVNYLDYPLKVTGNSVFLAKAADRKNLSNTVIESSSDLVTIYPVDNWGFIFQRLSENNRWPGGDVNAAGSSSATIKLDAVSIPIEFKTEVDENNNVFLEGLYTDKVIRVPQSGRSGKIKIELFPYRFDSAYLPSNADMFYLSLYDATTDEYSPYVDGDGIFSYLYMQRDGLDFTVDYIINANNTGSIRNSIVVFTYNDHQNLKFLTMHFIQETSSQNRIYFGQKSDSQYWDKYTNIEDNATANRVYRYYDTSAGTYKWSADESKYDSSWAFDTAGSHVLTEDSFTLSSPYSNWHFMYPEDLTNRYTITASDSISRTPDRMPYKWGGVDYKLIGSIPSSVTYTFTKK